LGNTKVEVKGVEAVASAALKLFGKSYEGTVRGLRVWGEETITRAKQNFVPVRFGVLRASGKAEIREGEESPSVELSFGGDSPAGEYAIYVHEIPAEHHVGEDKYLEKPALQESGHLAADIMVQVKRATGIK
jgi:hypothetical protein